MTQVGQEILNVPMGDMIRQMAFAIADAQVHLDQASVLMAEVLCGKRVVRNADGSPKTHTSGVDKGKVETIDTRVYFGADDKGEPQQLSLVELGFTPNFYQFVDTLIEVKIAVKISTVTEYDQTNRTSANTYGTAWGLSFSGGAIGSSTRSVATATSVDASYAAKYNYSAEGASLLRTKLVPVPPPAILEERIRKLMEAKKPEET